MELGLEVDEFFSQGLDQIGSLGVWQAEDKTRYLFLTNLQPLCPPSDCGPEEDKRRIKERQGNTPAQINGGNDVKKEVIKK